MSNPKNTLSQDVTRFLDNLKHPLRQEIEQLRIRILNSNKPLTENIKWNGPNYCFENEDRITMKIHPPTAVQLVFHCGAKVQEQPKEKLIQEHSGFLLWKGNDRAVATFKTMKDIENRKAEIRQIVSDWISATSKKLD
ncbi:MAG: DUF1801 domain-containing protein [Ginsengibacter sp.]